MEKRDALLEIQNCLPRFCGNAWRLFFSDERGNGQLGLPGMRRQNEFRFEREFFLDGSFFGFENVVELGNAFRFLD